MKIGNMPERNLNLLDLKENAFPSDKVTASFFLFLCTWNLII